MKSIYLICYDISNDKNRTKISEELEQYGERINYSVFECFITPAQLNNILSFIEEKMDKKHDSVKYYYICKSCYLKSNELGKKQEKTMETKFIKTKRSNR